MTTKLVIKSSPQLYAFYKRWHMWATTCPQSSEFDSREGLCSPLYRFGPRLLGEIAAQFFTAGLDTHYPFDYSRYRSCKLAATQHLDPNRLAWLTDRIADGVKEI